MTNDNETGLAVLDSSVPSFFMESGVDAIANLKTMKAGINIAGNVHNFSAGETIRGYVAGIKKMVDKSDETKMISAIRFVMESPSKDGKAVTVILSDVVIRTTLEDVAIGVETSIRNGESPNYQAFEITCTEEGVKGDKGKYKKFAIHLMF